jgi:hypothetical protein
MMTEPATPAAAPTPDELRKRQRARSMAIAGGLLLLVVFFYLITIFRMGGEVIKRSV